MSAGRFRTLPSVQEVDHFLAQQGLPHGKPVRHWVHQALQHCRARLQEDPSPPESRQEALEWVASVVQHSLPQRAEKVLNLTGVVVHTNLGRSPLPRALLEPLLSQWSHYTPLEFDLATGKRGHRDTALRQLLRGLSGAESALAVNNNAAAVFLMLRTLAAGREVIVSRGELVEIGGSFRIPDIMREAGCELVEVGTTNRTRLSDYESAITERTAALLKVHPSNYSLVGFTEEVALPELAQLARQRNLHSLYDWGSGSFYAFQQQGLREYPTAQQVLASGVDVVAFSGDKLLGGVQAGLMLGRQPLLDQIRKHPLYRAFRLDKLALSTLEAVLQTYWNPEQVPEHLLTPHLLERTPEGIRATVEGVRESLVPGPAWSLQSQPMTSLTGGGALPELQLPSWGLVLQHETASAHDLQERLRREGPLPVIGRIVDHTLWLDFRTLLPDEVPELCSCLEQLLQS